MPDSSQNIWTRCLEFFRNNMNEQQYQTWFEPLRFVSYDEQTHQLVIFIPTHFFYEYLEEHFRKLIWTAAIRFYGQGTTVHYSVGITKTVTENLPSDEAPFIERPRTERLANQSPTLAQSVGELDPQLNPQQNFDNFIEGNSNKLPRSVGKAIAEHPEQKTFNPLFIYGHSGVGKTHLMNAIGVALKQLHPRKRVLYLSAHLFMVQYADATRNNKTVDFMHFYQSIDVLLMDDIQELSGLKGTQNAFFHIFNHLHQNGCQIVLACDRPPIYLEGMEERLITRFKWGLMAELEQPEESLRRHILENKIRHDGLEIPQDVIAYLSHNITDSIRELEGVVNSLLAYSVVLNREIDLQLAKQILHSNIQKEGKEPTMDQILQQTCACCNVTQEDLCGKSRKAHIVEARQLSIYVAQKHTHLTSGKIGALVGNRDHATVIHSVKTIEKKLLSDTRLQGWLTEIEKKLTE